MTSCGTKEARPTSHFPHKGHLTLLPIVGSMTWKGALREMDLPWWQVAEAIAMG